MTKRDAVIKKLEEMNDDEFWDWVSGWLDPEIIMDMVNSWDDDIFEEEFEYLGLHTEKEV